MKQRPGEGGSSRPVVIGSTILLVLGFIAVAAAVVPIVFLKGDISTNCSHRLSPPGALVSEAPEAHPIGALSFWPLGIQCAYPSASGGDFIVISDTWAKTVAFYGGIVTMGFGGLLLRVRRRGKYV